MTLSHVTGNTNTNSNKKVPAHIPFRFQPLPSLALGSHLLLSIARSLGPHFLLPQIPESNPPAPLPSDPEVPVLSGESTCSPSGSNPSPWFSHFPEASQIRPPSSSSLQTPKFPLPPTAQGSPLGPQVWLLDPSSIRLSTPSSQCLYSSEPWSLSPSRPTAPSHRKTLRLPGLLPQDPGVPAPNLPVSLPRSPSSRLINDRRSVT